MRPGIVKSPNKAKRNRELSELPNFPYLCGVFLPSYRPQRYFDRPAGIRPGGVFAAINGCADFAPVSWPPIPADSCTNNRIGIIPHKSPFRIGNGPSLPVPIRCKTRTFLSERPDARPVQTSGQYLSPYLTNACSIGNSLYEHEKPSTYHIGSGKNKPPIGFAITLTKSAAFL